MNVTYDEIARFMEEANTIFPTDAQHNHCLVGVDGNLRLHIWADNKFWQVDLDNDDEWRNPATTLEHLKNEYFKN